MKEEDDIIYGPYPLGEVIVTPDKNYDSEIEYIKDLYFSISGDVYDRNPALFQKAIRFMQRNRDLKGESYIFNKCVNSATNRVAREYVLPVLLGAAAIPIAIEAGPILAALRSPAWNAIGRPAWNTVRGPVWNTIRGPVWSAIRSKYTQRLTYVRMGSNWLIQSLLYGRDEIDYVSVFAEGLTVGGSAVSSLIEFRPFAKDNPVLKTAFINKSIEDSSVDIATSLVGAGVIKGVSMLPGKEVFAEYQWLKPLLDGGGSIAYSALRTGLFLGSDKIKDEIENAKKSDWENETDSRSK